MAPREIAAMDLGVRLNDGMMKWVTVLYCSRHVTTVTASFAAIDSYNMT